MQGRHDEAIAEFQKIRAVMPDNPDFIALLGSSYGLAGQRNQARLYLGELNEVAKRRYVSSFAYVGIHAGLGEMDLAFKWLEKSYMERDPILCGLKTDPMFDVVRADSRFALLQRRAGLAP
jgi:tetratricopeptide (TPR) repeat protein